MPDQSMEGKSRSDDDDDDDGDRKPPAKRTKLEVELHNKATDNTQQGLEETTPSSKRQR